MRIILQGSSAEGKTLLATIIARALSTAGIKHEVTRTEADGNKWDKYSTGDLVAYFKGAQRDVIVFDGVSTFAPAPGFLPPPAGDIETGHGEHSAFLTDKQKTAVRCAYADLAGVYQTLIRDGRGVHDGHDWKAHRTSIAELEDAFDFIEAVEIDDKTQDATADPEETEGS